MATFWRSPYNGNGLSSASLIRKQWLPENAGANSISPRRPLSKHDFTGRIKSILKSSSTSHESVHSDSLDKRRKFSEAETGNGAAVGNALPVSSKSRERRVQFIDIVKEKPKEVPRINLKLRVARELTSDGRETLDPAEKMASRTRNASKEEETKRRQRAFFIPRNLACERLPGEAGDRSAGVSEREPLASRKLMIRIPSPQTAAISVYETKPRPGTCNSVKRPAEPRRSAALKSDPASLWGQSPYSQRHSRPKSSFRSTVSDQYGFNSYTGHYSREKHINFCDKNKTNQILNWLEDVYNAQRSEGQFCIVNSVPS